MTDDLTQAGATFTELVLEIFHVNGLILEEGDDLTRPVGLSSSRWQVLAAIESSSKPVADIARIMGLSRQAVQRTADVLERDGFVEYRENPHHKRAKLVVLTPKARGALESIDQRQARWWANGLGKTYTAERVQDALLLLRQLSQDLEDADGAAVAVSSKGKEIL